jgi:pimeloyl-ACP methyl ester carboxylesterase
MLAAAALVVLLIVAGGILFELIGEAWDLWRWPPTGALREVGGHRLHIDREGECGPVVVFESGIAASSLSWKLVQPRVAKFARTCSYDRAGLGWSDGSRTPPSLDAIVHDLRALLSAVGLPGPYIFVAHSFGGLVARWYASHYPEEIAALVLVDPLAACEWACPDDVHKRMLARGVQLSRRGKMLARFGVVRLCLDLAMAGARSLPKLVAKLTSGGAKTPDRMTGEIRKLPREVWPMVKSHWCRPKCFEAMARHLEWLPENSVAALAATVPAEIPVTVLAAFDCAEARLREYETMTKRSAAGRQVKMEDCGHWIHLDRSEAVVAAIRDLAGL